jgi:hypothetical protein
MECRVRRMGSYQGVPQWGITGSSEVTPSRSVAQKWAQLENADRAKDAARHREALRHQWATNTLD